MYATPGVPTAAAAATEAASAAVHAATKRSQPGRPRTTLAAELIMAGRTRTRLALPIAPPRAGLQPRTAPPSAPSPVHAAHTVITVTVTQKDVVPPTSRRS